MADLGKELEALHAAVVNVIRARVENGSEDEDGNLQPTSNDDLRVALQLLKQNSVTANLSRVETDLMKSKMAGKLNFSALQEKVIPIRTANPPPAGARPHANDESQRA